MVQQPPVRSLSLVTWDSEAKLSIDPSIIGSSIEAYLATEKLDKLEELEEQSNNDNQQQQFAVTVRRSSTKANRKAAQV